MIEVELDPTRFPTLRAYLDSLPDGLSSHPDCRSKASIMAASLDHEIGAEVLELLPAAIVELIESPPPANIWIPAVHSDALFHLLCDVHYPRHTDMLEWIERRTRKMAAHKMYQSLMRVAGPKILLRSAAMAHGLFQKGTDLEAEIFASGARLVLSYAPYLHSSLNTLSNVPLWRVVIELTGGEDVHVERTEHGSRRAVYECTWV